MFRAAPGPGSWLVSVVPRASSSQSRPAAGPRWSIQPYDCSVPDRTSRAGMVTADVGPGSRVQTTRQIQPPSSIHPSTPSNSSLFSAPPPSEPCPAIPRPAVHHDRGRGQASRRAGWLHVGSWACPEILSPAARSCSSVSRQRRAHSHRIEARRLGIRSRYSDGKHSMHTPVRGAPRWRNMVTGLDRVPVDDGIQYPAGADIFNAPRS